MQTKSTMNQALLKNQSNNDVHYDKGESKGTIYDIKREANGNWILGRFV